MSDNIFIPLAIDLGSFGLVSLGLACLALIFSSYIKIVTVLSIIRVGLGLNSIPSAFVTCGLAFSLALFVMFPTLLDSAQIMRASGIGSSATINNQDRAVALGKGIDEWKRFLVAHTHASELQAFVQISKRLRHDKSGSRQLDQKNASDSSSTENLSTGKNETKQTHEWHILAPAFMVSELKEAFAIGLSLFLPFLVVELLVAHTLVAVGLTQLNPHIVSFPFKLLLFVLADGWSVITTNLVSTYA